MIARLHGIGMTEVRISETVEKTFAIAEKTLVIVGKIGVTVERIFATAEVTGTTAEKIIRITGRIGVPTKGISRATGDTDMTTEEISGVTVETDATTEEISKTTGDTGVTTAKISGVIGESGTITEGISRVTGDSGVITKGISERIVEIDGIINDIIPQGQIAGTDTLLNVTDMHIPADLTEEEDGAKFTDVRFFPVYSGCQKTVPVFKRFFLQPLMPLFHNSEHYYGKRYKKQRQPNAEVAAHFLWPATQI